MAMIIQHCIVDLLAQQPWSHTQRENVEWSVHRITLNKGNSV